MEHKIEARDRIWECSTCDGKGQEICSKTENDAELGQEAGEAAAKVKERKSFKMKRMTNSIEYLGMLKAGEIPLHLVSY